MFENMEEGKKAPTEKVSAADNALGDREIEKVKSLVAQLEPLATKAGCSVAELVEEHCSDDEAAADDESDESESEDGGGKLALIVARMKAKQGAGEE